MNTAPAEALFCLEVMRDSHQTNKQTTALARTAVVRLGPLGFSEEELNYILVLLE